MVTQDHPGDEILEIVQENMDYFREHSKHLGWAVMQFELLGRASLFLGNEDIVSPKGQILAIAEEMEHPGDGTLVFDAWFNTIIAMDIFTFPDTHPDIPPGDKVGKTLDEWIGVKGHPLYR